MKEINKLASTITLVTALAASGCSHGAAKPVDKAEAGSVPFNQADCVKFMAIVGLRQGEPLKDPNGVATYYIYNDGTYHGANNVTELRHVSQTGSQTRDLIYGYDQRNEHYDDGSAMHIQISPGSGQAIKASGWLCVAATTSQTGLAV